MAELLEPKLYPTVPYHEQARIRAQRPRKVSVQGVQSVKVNMVFDPPWDQSRMSDEARVALDMW